MMKAASPGSRALFAVLSAHCDGHTIEDIISASGNLMINALRQAHASRADAEARWDEISANMKKLLWQHYDSFGRLKGIYPYTQHIEMPLFDARPRKK